MHHKCILSVWEPCSDKAQQTCEIPPVPAREREFTRDAKEEAMSLALRKPSSIDRTEQSADGLASARDEVSEYDDGLLAIAGPIMLLCYSLLFTIAAVTFISRKDALFAVVISVFFAVVLFAIPLLFLKIRAARDWRWRKDTDIATGPVVEIWTGSMRRWEAIVQIVSIPLAILMGFTLLAIRWSAL